MKKTQLFAFIVIALFTISGTHLFAQWSTSCSYPYSDCTSGNVQIGGTCNAAGFNCSGDIQCSGFLICTGTYTTSGISAPSGQFGRIINTDYARIAGKVGIGGLDPNNPTDCPGSYYLYVKSGILTEHVKVATYGSTDWADFVFNKDYKLMPLKKLESYLNTNKHLPDVPSAKEVAKDGIDLGDMDAKLLQKIEELTLYTIQLQKQITQIQKRNDELNKKIETLQK